MDVEMYSRMLPVFLEEAEAKLREMDRAIAALASDHGDAAARGALGRAVHTLRGNAAMLGLSAIVRAAEDIERRWPLAPAPADLAALCAARAGLRVLLDDVADDLWSLSTT